jgi:hypothetical protein
MRVKSLFVHPVDTKTHKTSLIWLLLLIKLEPPFFCVFKCNFFFIINHVTMKIKIKTFPLLLILFDLFLISPHFHSTLSLIYNTGNYYIIHVYICDSGDFHDWSAAAAQKTSQLGSHHFPLFIIQLPKFFRFPMIYFILFHSTKTEFSIFICLFITQIVKLFLF